MRTRIVAAVGPLSSAGGQRLVLVAQPPPDLERQILLHVDDGSARLAQSEKRVFAIRLNSNFSDFCRLANLVFFISQITKARATKFHKFVSLIL